MLSVFMHSLTESKMMDSPMDYQTKQGKSFIIISIYWQENWGSERSEYIAEIQIQGCMPPPK